MIFAAASAPAHDLDFVGGHAVEQGQALLRLGDVEATALGRRAGGRSRARRLFVQEATTELYAALRSAIAGFEGKFVEAHMLDARTVRRIPKKAIGRVLSLKEGKALIERMG